MAISKPITRVEQYLAHISGMRVNVPEVPLTREEMYLAAWARKSGIEDTEMQGEPPLTLKDCIGEPFNGLVLYGKSTQVTTTGTQLFEPISDSLNLNGVVITFGKNGEKIVVSGTAVLSQEIQISKPIQMQAGEKYVLTLDEVHYFDNIWLQGNGVRFGWSGKNTANKVIITVPDSIAERTDCAMYASTSKGKAYNFTINHLMLNTGSTALPWEPYTGGKPSPSPDYQQEIVSAGDAGNLSVIVKNPDNEQMQSVPFSTPNGLPGIPVSSGGNYTDSNGQQWICDEIDFGRGVYVQRIGVLMLDDKSKILSMSKWDNNHLDVVQPYRVTNFTMSKRKVICDRLPSEEKREAWSRDIEMIGGVFKKNGTDFYIDFYIKNQRLGTTKDTNPDDAISAALKWLKENPLSCKYALATPIETPLSETDIAAYRALTTYKGTTILESECYLKVKYSKLRK